MGCNCKEMENLNSLSIIMEKNYEATKKKMMKTIKIVNYLLVFLLTLTVLTVLWLIF